MATLGVGHSPNFWGVLSETKRIIRANSSNFLALSILFLLPLSVALILYPSLLTTLSQPNPIIHQSPFIFSYTAPDPTIPSPQKSHLLITLLYFLFVFLFSIFATASITYSTFHGFYGRPVNYISSIKSILFSFFPLLVTVIASQMILISIFFILGFFAVSLYQYEGFGSNYYLGFVIFMTILNLVVTFYLQVEWSLAYAVVVVESKWGFASLKRSAYLIKGMKWVALSIMLFNVILTGFLAILCSMLISNIDGSIWDWGYIPQTVLTSGVMTTLMLYNVAAYTVLYMYCKALHGEMAFEIAEDSGPDYISLPIDDGNVPHVIYVVPH